MVGRSASVVKWPKPVDICSHVVGRTAISDDQPDQMAVRCELTPRRLRHRQVEAGKDSQHYRRCFALERVVTAVVVDDDLRFRCRRVLFRTSRKARRSRLVEHRVEKTSCSFRACTRPMNAISWSESRSLRVTASSIMATAPNRRLRGVEQGQAGEHLIVVRVSVEPNVCQDARSLEKGNLFRQPKATGQTFPRPAYL